MTAPDTQETNPRPVSMFVGSYLPYSETFIYDQLRTHRRYRAEVFCYETLESAKRFPYEPVHALSPGQSLRYRVLGSAPNFDQILRQGQFELMHAHFGINGSYAAPFAKTHNLPLVVTFHGHDVPALIGRNRFTLSYGRYALTAPRMFRQAKLLLPASQDLADRLIRDLGADPSRVEVHALGIDTKRFVARDHSHDDPRVIMVGRFTDKKGHRYGFEAFARALAQIPQARLTLIGDGELRDDYRKQIRQLGIEHAVDFAGILTPDEVAQTIREHRVMICPSVTAKNGDIESGVMVVKEAGAAELPVIGSRHGGIPDIIADGESGYIVEERDVNALAAHLIELLKDPALCQKMGQAARKRICEHFEIHRQAERLEDIFDKVLS